jgi:hypothetical protein
MLQSAHARLCDKPVLDHSSARRSVVSVNAPEWAVVSRPLGRDLSIGAHQTSQISSPPTEYLFRIVELIFLGSSHCLVRRASSIQRSEHMARNKAGAMQASVRLGPHRCCVTEIDDLSNEPCL